MELERNEKLERERDFLQRQLRLYKRILLDNLELLESAGPDVGAEDGASDAEGLLWVRFGAEGATSFSAGDGAAHVQDIMRPTLASEKEKQHTEKHGMSDLSSSTQSTLHPADQSLSLLNKQAELSQMAQHLHI